MLLGDILAILFLLGCVIFLISMHIRENINEKREVAQQGIKELDWDEDFLRAEAKKHQLDKIVPCKVVWTFGKPGIPRDGLKWVCTCGAEKGNTDLKVTEYSFKKHQEKMRELALAELGRFK